mmetsp:Transcript_12167/g.20178  ORF Transcript_12167/g.20178 Transcript_12167/m.20178 type:complete len:165 (-) Transcript_12167:511-1005(-)
MPCFELAQLLGGPDYVCRAPPGAYWRYDIGIIDHVDSYSNVDSTTWLPPSSYTLLVWLSKIDETVETVVRYFPPFWRVDIEDYFQTKHQHQLTRCSGNCGPCIGVDGDAVFGNCDLLQESFLGTKETLVPFQEGSILETQQTLKYDAVTRTATLAKDYQTVKRD